MTYTLTVGELKEAIEKSGLLDTASVKIKTRMNNTHAAVSVVKHRLNDGPFCLVIHSIKDIK